MPETKDANFRKEWPWKKLAVLALVAVAGVFAYTQFGDVLNLQSLAQQESQMRDFQLDHPVLVYGIAFVIYVVVTGLSLPGAAVLTLVYGWYFGLLPAVVVVSFASTMGATLAFLLSRFLFRDAIQKRFGDRLTKFNESLEREGPFFLFTLRLIPAVPFFVINAVMGLTPIRTRTFWWVSQLGMYPQDAGDAGIEIDTYTQQFEHVDRAILEGSDDGFVKVHTKKGTDKIVGATIVAENAGDMISEINVAMTNGLGLSKIGATIYPYPTQAEAIRKLGDQYNKTKLTSFSQKVLGMLMKLNVGG